MDNRGPLRTGGDNVWRPPLALRSTYVVMAIGLLGLTYWAFFDGSPLSLVDWAYVGAVILLVVIFLPVIVFRWRLVLDRDELTVVFFAVRRMPVRDIVQAASVAREGLVFTARNGSVLSFAALGNTAWGHRRSRPTRSDLVARTVLCAAAVSRGEDPPRDYRLPPVFGWKKAALQDGIIAAILGFFLSN